MKGIGNKILTTYTKVPLPSLLNDIIYETLNDWKKITFNWIVGQRTHAFWLAWSNGRVNLLKNN